ncbi:hypothetical protein EZV73_22470 [Acidaminobacter sp. JC074]|uniref:thiamine phosphate synthase n=1 Tax=Acidaminobacter sp. JC074 TaxID=2530199 RepID=UPI001F0F75D3|nr:hypothetical protein [Acidaminobacter sp. JC074]MCH4890365.1 hypothetical protein [Acidaminobacter sp. JC074]
MIFLFTNRLACGDNALLLKIREASLAGADYILLRENDLSDKAYKDFALSALQMMTGTETDLVICHRDHIADELKLKKHNRFYDYKNDSFTVSIHGEEEYKKINGGLFFYSPIFPSKCKPGVKEKGLFFKKEGMIALGGVTLDKLKLLDGIDHIGVMSEWLETDNTFELIRNYKISGY